MYSNSAVVLELGQTTDSIGISYTKGRPSY